MYYFIGIKGSGMAPLAEILHELGNDVCGSDIDKYIFIEDELRKRNIPIYSLQKGDKLTLGNHIVFDIIHPNKDFNSKDDNNNSLVFKLTYKNKGDIND